MGLFSDAGEAHLHPKINPHIRRSPSIVDISSLAGLSAFKYFLPTDASFLVNASDAAGVIPSSDSFGRAHASFLPTSSSFLGLPPPLATKSSIDEKGFLDIPGAQQSKPLYIYIFHVHGLIFQV